MNKPLWEPSDERIERANLNRFMRFVREQTGNDDIRRYAPLYDFSVRHPARFWPLVWEFCGIRASGDFDPVLADAEQMPGARWFPEVRLNVAQNLLRFRDDRPALVAYDDTGASHTLSYAALHGEVARVTQALARAGVGNGDRVAAALPPGAERVVALLATIALGALWAPVPLREDGMLDPAYLAELAPKLLFLGGPPAADPSLPATVRQAAPSITTVVTLAPAGPQAVTAGPVVSWAAFGADEAPAPAFELLPFAHPLYLLPSASGTAGIVHGAGGTLIQHLKELVLHLDLKREDRIVLATDDLPTWHWLVSALAVGATLILDARIADAAPEALWDRLDEVGASVLVTRSRTLAAAAAADLAPMHTHKLQNLRTIAVTGPAPPAEAYDYVYGAIKQRVLLAAVAGGPDLVSCLAIGNPLLPIHRGELQCRGLGMRVDVLDAHGRPLRDADGELACLAPFPALPLGFWNDPDGERYRQACFGGREGTWHQGIRARLTVRDGIVVADPAPWPTASPTAASAA